MNILEYFKWKNEEIELTPKEKCIVQYLIRKTEDPNEYIENYEKTIEAWTYAEACKVYALTLLGGRTTKLQLRNKMMELYKIDFEQ